jgi:flagellar motor switch protein FliN/FliY
MFQEVWPSSIYKVLKRLTGGEFEARVLESTPVSVNADSSGVWSRFAATGLLTGEFALFVSKSDALLLYQLMRGKVSEECAEISSEVRETVAELFRRFVDEALPVLKSKTGGEVVSAFCGFDPPGWEVCLGFPLEIAGSKTRPLQICFIADESLAKSATAAIAAVPASRPTSQSEKVMATPVPALPGKENLGLLLDIKLEAMLRFGEREMLLREILNLNPGSLVELNRKVNDPVELIVCGKVVAKGDVVVLDGNYALLVTQVGSPADRMPSPSS